MKHSDNRVLAVWGSPSCGKTTIAAKIAGYIADKGFDVGSILAAARITENLVMQNAITFKKNKHIVAFGLMKGENSFSYPKYTQVQAKELIDTLRDIADFVVIDCSCHLSDDILSTVSLIEADCVLRLINCDLKSISYLSKEFRVMIEQIAEEVFELD